MSEFTQESPQTNWLSRPISLATLDWEKLIYIAFILIAILTRFVDLGSRVVSHDESLHTQYSYQFYNGEGFSHTPLMHGPLLFHLSAASYWLFGASDFSARVPVAIFGVLLVVIPYFMRDWLGRVGALFTAFIFLISPYVTYYSRYIRHDIYAIIFALLIFIATLYYLRDREEKYLWWFAGSLAMLFTTKEVSYIYVATFGSFLILRLIARLVIMETFRQKLPKLIVPLLIVGLGVGLCGTGVIMTSRAHGDEGEGSAELIEGEPAPEVVEISEPSRIGNALAVTGFMILTAGLFYAVLNFRDILEAFPEYDLIIMYAALLLPAMSALIIKFAGYDPLNATFKSCQIARESGEALTTFQTFIGRLTQGQCWNAFFTSDAFVYWLITGGLLIIGLAVGIWWGGRRFIGPAILFHILFGLFYTSFLTNLPGWGSGMVGSLGYWLDQQEVARGGQPSFYYLIVVPLYEFLPVIFSTLAIREWLKTRNLNWHIGSALGTLTVSAIAYSYVNWLFGRTTAGTAFSTQGMIIIILIAFALLAYRLYTRTQGAETNGLLNFISNALLLTAILVVGAGLPFTGEAFTGEAGQDASRLPGIVAALATLGLGFVGWWLIARGNDTSDIPFRERLAPVETFGFIPHLTWWLLLTWVAYSYAGEKMPWLSTHFVIPMGFLVGWYFTQKLRNIDFDVRAQNFAPLLALTTATLGAGFLALQSLLVTVNLGSKTNADLTSIGGFLGKTVAFGLLLALTLYIAQQVAPRLQKTSWLLGSFLVLSFLTIRFTYLANFVNDDYTNEYLVYAHGAPATKAQVLNQLETVSTRLYGDNSVKVVFDDDSSWPFYWYLRDYPNRQFVGGNPGADILDAPVLIIGDDNWEEVDAIVRDKYVYDTYTYLWWPMEEYRNISWNSILGVNSTDEAPRGIASLGVRQALWDIFFNRDFEKYGEVFGGNYSLGEWPLRDSLRIYIRQDVVGELWDTGLFATAYVPPVDPYADGEIETFASTVFGDRSTLNRPRNVAVANDGRVYVADSANHRIQVFNADGSAAFSFGSNGAEQGQFNEPWGIAIDEQFVYVADTWNGRIQTFNLEGEFVSTFGSFNSPTETDIGEYAFYGPRDISLGDDGSMYVTDTGNHRVLKYDRQGIYLGQIGNQGFGIGQFSEPTSLTVGPDGTVHVAEAWSQRIQQISSDLIALGEFSVEAWDGQSLDNKPYITMDGGGRIYMTDPEGFQVLVFDTVGTYLGRFGRYGTDNASFDLPTGIATDAENNVYVVDTNNNRVLKFPPINLDG